MSRVMQGPGTRGSLKWIQRATAEHWHDLEHPLLKRLDRATSIDWRSPRADDAYAEYRDAAFLELLGLAHLKEALGVFWPNRGPQWDALGLTDAGDCLLVEAKAHVGEMCSPPTSAGPASRARIAARLDEVAASLQAKAARAPWTDVFYQLANRIAHLAFLRANGVPAFLVLVSFVNDTDMNGPASPEVWRAAYHVALHAMGLSQNHPLSRFVVEVYPDVAIHGGSVASR